MIQDLKKTGKDNLKIELQKNCSDKYEKMENENNSQKLAITINNPIITSHKLHYVNPCSHYSPISAHTYMLRYAKNHGKKLDDVLFDVIQIEEKRKLYS